MSRKLDVVIFTLFTIKQDCVEGDDSCSGWTNASVARLSGPNHRNIVTIQLLPTIPMTFSGSNLLC